MLSELLKSDEALFVKERLNLSDNSISKIIIHVDNLLKWQRSLNLIGKSSIPDMWKRHVLDSGQLKLYLPKESKNKLILDVGTGAGFPGLVLAAMGREDIYLCDKNKNKISFILDTVKKMEIKNKVICARVQEMHEKNVKVIISRAFAPLYKLITHVYNFITEDTILLLLKGKNINLEINQAEKLFSFKYILYPSLSSNYGRIIKIYKIKRKYHDWQ